MRTRLEWPFFINGLDTLYSFKRKAKAITIDTPAAIDLGDDEVQIDPVLLFQRFIISGYQANDLGNALTQELSNYNQFCWKERQALQRRASCMRAERDVRAGK